MSSQRTEPYLAPYWKRRTKWYCPFCGHQEDTSDAIMSHTCVMCHTRMKKMGKFNG